MLQAYVKIEIPVFKNMNAHSCNIILFHCISAFKLKNGKQTIILNLYTTIQTKIMGNFLGVFLCFESEFNKISLRFSLNLSGA